MAEVQQRLAHAHEHDGLELAADGEGFAAEGEELLDDFAGGEVALEAGLRRRAEIAAHGATDLGGDAAGGAIGAEVGHEHGLDCTAIVETEEQFCRAVGSDLAGGEGRSSHVRNDRADFFGEARGQAEMLGRRFRGVVENPAGHVERAEHAGGVRGLVAPRRELALEVGEADVGEGGVHGFASRPRRTSRCLRSGSWPVKFL